MVALPATPTILLAASTTALTASPTCTTAIPDKNGYVPPDSCNANYGFYPRWEDNVAFAIAFGLATAAHLAQSIILKKVRLLMFPLVIPDAAQTYWRLAAFLLGHHYGCSVGVHLLRVACLGGQRPARIDLRHSFDALVPPRAAL